MLGWAYTLITENVKDKQKKKIVLISSYVESMFLAFYLCLLKKYLPAGYERIS